MEIKLNLHTLWTLYVCVIHYSCSLFGICLRTKVRALKTAFPSPAHTPTHARACTTNDYSRIHIFETC